MIVLVTRPLSDAQATAHKLRRLGHAPVLSPVIDIVPLQPVWPHTPPEALIATSDHAFSSPLPPGWAGLPLFAVGAHTAKQHEGPVSIGSGGARALLDVVKASGFQRFVYLAGRQRKPEFETKFAMGQLTIVETYDAQAATTFTPDAAQALAQGRVSAVLHYSRRSCALCLELAEQAGLALPSRHLCLSHDVAGPLEMRGLQPEIAQMPHEKALLALL